MALLEFEGVNKYFGDTHVLRDVDLSVDERDQNVNTSTPSVS